MGLWIPNVSILFRSNELNKAFLKTVYDVMLLILMPSYDIWKERIFRILCPAVKRWDIVLFLVS